MIAYLRSAEPGLYVRGAHIARRLGVCVSTVRYHVWKLRGVVESRKGPGRRIQAASEAHQRPQNEAGPVGAAKQSVAQEHLVSEHPLRDLARRVTALTLEHPAASQAGAIVQNCCDHLCAVARVHEANNEILAAESLHASYQLSLQQPTHRHVKRGTLYRVTGTGQLQAAAPVVEGARLVHYVGENGDAWCRPYDEFFDGRFEELGKKEHLPE